MSKSDFVQLAQRRKTLQHFSLLLLVQPSQHTEAKK
jgi:hypothetical protein